MKVLIAVEESECSEKALESVMDRPWPANSEFRVVNVHEPIRGYDPIIYTPKSIESLTEIDKEIYSAKRSRVTKAMERIKSTASNAIVSGDVLTGHPLDCILDEAKQWGADLIVVGSHSRKGFARAFLGSVAEGVARQADCSVEIIRSAKRTH